MLDEQMLDVFSGLPRFPRIPWNQRREGNKGKGIQTQMKTQIVAVCSMSDVTQVQSQ